MSTLKMVYNNNYNNINIKENAIEYILNPFRAISGYVGGVGVSPECPAESMQLVSEIFNKMNGIQIRHYILSFDPEEFSAPYIVNDIAVQIAHTIGKEYQVVFAVHENKPHLHVHFIVNTISYIDGHRHRGTHAEFYGLKSRVSDILKKYGVNVLIYV